MKLISIELEAHGHEVDILFLRKRQKGGWDDIKDKVNLIYSTFDNQKKALIYLVKEVKRRSVNPYYFTISSAAGINGLLGLFRRIGILKTRYLISRESTQLLDRFGGIKGFLFRRLYQWGYPQSDLVICQTSFMKERLLATVPKAKYWNVHVVANPINLKEIVGKSAEPINLPFGKDVPFILGVGRLIKLKGFDLLISAFAELDNKYNLVIVGSGDESEVLKDLADKMNVGSRVHLVGYADNPSPYMKLAHLCVLSSRVEGFPNTLLQMMAVNERVVSTTCAGDIDKLKGVVTCDVNDTNKLFAAMNSALNMEFEELNSNRIAFDKELKGRTTKKFYDKILSLLPA